MGSPTVTAPAPKESAIFSRADVVILGGSVVLILLAAITRFVPSGKILPFAFSALAVALLATVVGRSVEQLGDRFGPGATGVLQSALGNLPELFIAIFALRAGLLAVVQAALIGSILANLLLVMGLCFVVGGVRHGVQTLGRGMARGTVVMMMLSVGAMILPSITAATHSPAADHEQALSVIAALVLLSMFVATLPESIRKKAAPQVAEAGEAELRWPLWLAVALLAAAALGAAFVSDWFVTALEPAMGALHISQAFAGLVVVAIAGNAVENVVGIQLAAAGRSEYAFSVVINSPIQIALALAPALVLLSALPGFTPLTLVFPPVLILAVVLSVLLAAFITFDGESTWSEGAALIGLYIVIAASFWWG